jgi:hypothetical protein
MLIKNVRGMGDLVMSLFIMAAGNSTRWKRYSPNHLPMHKLEAIIYDKPLIQWTIDQLKVRNKHFTIVTRNDIGPTTSIVHSIHVLRAKWKGTCTFLCGDVMWTDAGLNLVLNFNTSDYQFFGNKYEIFALKFKPSMHKWMSLMMEETRKTSEGKLRDLRKMLAFGNPNLNVVEEISRNLDSNFTFIRDWTQDIDHYASYTRFLSIEAAKEELLAR